MSPIAAIGKHQRLGPMRQALACVSAPVSPLLPTFPFLARPGSYSHGWCKWSFRPAWGWRKTDRPQIAGH